VQPKRSLSRVILSWGIFSTICCSALYAQRGVGNTAVPVRPGTRSQPAQDPVATERGGRLFSSACAFCHGATARGGATGPDLVRSEIVLDDEKGDLIRPLVRSGIAEKGMPAFPAISDAEISDIVTWLHVQTAAVSNRGAYQTLNIVTGDPKAGEAYFNGAGGCTKCHSVSGDLAHISAKYDAQNLQSRFLMPRPRAGRGASATTSGKPVQVTVTLPNGSSFSGVLSFIDDFNVALRDASGEFHSFSRTGATPKVDIEDPYLAHEQLLRKYTDADMHNLTAFLVTLK